MKKFFVLLTLVTQSCSIGTKSDQLIQTLYKGEHKKDKGVLIANISFKDDFRPDKSKNEISLCFNKKNNIASDNFNLNCDLTIPVKMEKQGDSIVRKWRAGEINRRKFSLDAFIYTYPNKENSMINYTQYFIVENPQKITLSDYGKIAYLGSLDIAVVEDIETEKPALAVKFTDDFSTFQNNIKKLEEEKGVYPNHNLKEVENLQLDSFTKRVKLKNMTVTQTRVISYSYVPIYVPK